MGIEVRTVEFEAAMQRLRSGVRKGFIDPAYGTLGVQGRLLAERCQAMTPPRSYSQGRKRVATDIRKAFQPLKASMFSSPQIQKIVRRDNRPAWDEAAKHFTSRNLKNTRASSFDKKHHERQRASRGRVFGSGGIVTLGSEATAVARYIREVQRRVGWAKGGWNMGILSLGGRVKDSWVSRHSVLRGIIKDGRSLPDPFIYVANNTGWGKDRNQSVKIVKSAISHRARDMQKYFEVQMKIAAEKAKGKPLPLAA